MYEKCKGLEGGKKMKKDMGNVGAAVIGLGRGMSHVEALLAAKGVELLAVCDINEEKIKKIAAEKGIDAYTDYKELLTREDIDLICVCTPSGLHCDMAIEIAKAGKHVLSEKPLDITISKMDSALKIFKEKGLKFGCIFQNRLEPANQKIKELVTSGRTGKLTLATAHVKWHRTQEYYQANGGWRGTWALDGGGSLMNQSVHTIDLMQWLMGPVKSVVGVTKVWDHDIETEDMGVALVKFESGAFGTIIGSTSTYPGFGTSLEIHGVDGGACMRDNRITVWKVKGENMEEEERSILERYGSGRKVAAGASNALAIKQDTTFLQVQDMVNAILEDRSPVIPAEEGRKAVEIILAIYESARTGKEVFLTYI